MFYISEFMITVFLPFFSVSCYLVMVNYVACNRIKLIYDKYFSSGGYISYI